MFTHIKSAIFHTLQILKRGVEQVFSHLSTENSAGYYYYLYIDKKGHQTNRLVKSNLHTFFGLSKVLNTVPDFQLKKKRLCSEIYS